MTSFPWRVIKKLRFQCFGFVHRNGTTINKITIFQLFTYLVRAKLYPLERTVGSVHCKGKRFQTCHNVKETENFTSTTTGKTFKINHKLNCNNKCLVYLLICNVCLKKYVGQAVEEFRYRWKNYKSNGRKYQEYGTCMQQHLLGIFLRRDTKVFWKMSLLH